MSIYTSIPLVVLIVLIYFYFYPVIESEELEDITITLLQVQSVQVITRFSFSLHKTNGGTRIIYLKYTPALLHDNWRLNYIIYFLRFSDPLS